MKASSKFSSGLLCSALTHFMSLVTCYRGYRKREYRKRSVAQNELKMFWSPFAMSQKMLSTWVLGHVLQSWVEKEVLNEILCDTGVGNEYANNLKPTFTINDQFPTICKPIYWFAEQCHWMVSIWKNVCCEWVNPFHVTGLSLYPLKASENICFLMFSGGIERD